MCCLYSFLPIGYKSLVVTWQSHQHQHHYFWCYSTVIDVDWKYMTISVVAGHYVIADPQRLVISFTIQSVLNVILINGLRSKWVYSLQMWRSYKQNKDENISLHFKAEKIIFSASLANQVFWRSLSFYKIFAVRYRRLTSFNIMTQKLQNYNYLCVISKMPRKWKLKFFSISYSGDHASSRW